ncbi:LuxR C-terminal-related transcriptional regulator [Leucobacter komagatae]|uniref:HTH luxR-type domain-containing protein n=1 Tax=Leucobacter komagatae TaxID=55969 RepID=A0A0D0HVV5_9MICO|nr:LuxR C-terminal-related transcriptional regulator [Leucobacter komagatae]KIP51761.1 hypothetical protein SD72_13365 [Leucobacter komagatae]
MDKRSEAMRQAVAALESGGSVQVFGGHGSGKTVFLHRVAERFETRGWRALKIRGNRSFSGTPLMALAIAGVVSAESGRVGAVAAAIDELDSLLPAQRALIVVDEPELVDDASGGVISELLARRRIALIVARAAGPRKQEAADFDWLTDPSGLGIRLGPMHYDDLSRIVGEHVSGPIGSAAMSQIFASSGGNPGLASAITASAVHEGRLVDREGEWGLTGSLWSDSLTPYLESVLTTLSSPQWDALEMLALLGIVEAKTFLELNDKDVPVQLEEASLIEFYPADGQLLVTVSPPLLVDYFRNRPAVARRHRLSEELEERFQGDRQSLARFQPRELTSSSDAPFVRLVHEHMRNRLILAQSEWERAPSKATAAQLIEVSITAGAPQEAIDTLFTVSESLHGDEAASVRWALLRSEYLIFAAGEHEQAIRYLEGEAHRYPRLGGLLLTRAFEVRSSVFRSGDAVDLPDPTNEDLDPRVRSAVHAVLGMHFMFRGRLPSAHQHLVAAELFTGRAESVDQIALHVLTSYFGDSPHEARGIGERGHARSMVSFSSVEIRGYNYLNALMGILDGRTRSVEEAIRVTLSLGAPIRRPPFVHITLLVLGTVLAARRGDAARVALFTAQLSALDAPDSPVPGGSRAWAHAQILASDGRPGEAADLMQRDADSNWERGLVLTAAFNYLIALEFEPTQERLDASRERILAVDSEYFSSFLEYITGIVASDAQALLSAASRFAQAGRFGHALTASRLAGAVAEAAGDTANAKRAHALWSQVSGNLPHDDYSEIALSASTPRFTTRELQIATLAVSGMSNQEIADELVLSVRTVESHMHRLMKKAGAESRSDLGSRLPNVRPGGRWD